MAPVATIDRSQRFDTGSDKVHPSPGELKSSFIKVTPTETPKAVSHTDTSQSSGVKSCTDHMLICNWTAEEGWATPRIIPYGPISMSPTSSVIQYSTSCFEGMKLFRGTDNRLRLFRPHLNCTRFLTSALRISLPGFNPDEMQALIEKLCAFEAPKWLPPNQPGSFLYIRPTLFGSDPSLGFEVPREATLAIFLVQWPIPNIDPNDSANGMKLLASKEDQIRAWPGGTGYAKIGANYGPALLAHGKAKKSGYSQVLWLYGPECYVTEAGSTNFFVIWRARGTGKLEMVTASLESGVILAGVTRQSMLDLARERFNEDGMKKFYGASKSVDVEVLEVVERDFTMFEVVEAVEEGRMLAAFAVGTAFSVNPVTDIHFRGQDLRIEAGQIPHLGLLKGWIMDIMYGREKSDWTVEIDG